MKIEDLMDEWEQDSKVSPFDLSGELLKTTALHAKYMKLLANFNLKTKSKSIEYKEKREWKRRYFKGEFNNPDDLALYNIQPYRGLVVNTDMQSILDADSELNKILLQKDYYDQCSKFCEEAVNELRARKFSIGNAIKWNIFQGGG